MDEHLRRVNKGSQPAALPPGGRCCAHFILYQQVENHILQPLVQRRTIQMNPLLVVITMLLGTSLAGLVGAILALPVAGAIQVLIRGLLLPDIERPA